MLRNQRRRKNNNQKTGSAEKEKISTATQIFVQACERSYSFPSCNKLVISNMLGFNFTGKKSLFLVQKQYQRMQNEKRPHNANRKLKV